MTQKTFSPRFEREAVRLLEQGIKEASQLVREIGVRRNQLYEWQAEIALHSEDAFPVHGGRPKQADNTTALKA